MTERGGARETENSVELMECITTTVTVSVETH